MNNITNMTQNIIKTLNKDVVTIAKQTQFSQRKSKLMPKNFVSTMVCGFLINNNASLEDLCQLLRDKRVNITKQGLHYKFGKNCNVFMEQVFKLFVKNFKEQNNALIGLTKCFTNIKILDSTIIALPKNLKEKYPSYGGSASEAALKIQVLFNSINENIELLDITSANNNDQGYEGHLDHIETGALYLQDLGYFVIETFKILQENNAYYISRMIHKDIKIYDPTNKKELHLTEILDFNKEIITRELLLSKNHMLKTRFVAIKLPENIVKERIRKAAATAKKQGRTLSEEKKALLKWSMYITNISEDTLKAEYIYTIYTFRWQIELLFKLGKSSAGIEKNSGKKESTIITELYAKLLGIIVLLYLVVPSKISMVSENSLIKAYNKLKNAGNIFYGSLDSEYKLKKFIIYLTEIFISYAGKDKYRKTKISSREKIYSLFNEVSSSITVNAEAAQYVA